jgi:Serine aminopeptidase, S33
MCMKEAAVRAGPVFGITSEPGTIGSRVGMIFLNAGLVHRVGPFLLYVDLARALSSKGFIAFRIDQSGKGDTPRRVGLSTEQTLFADFDDSVRYLHQSHGVERVVVLGLCSGADDAVRLAAARDQVAGIVLFDGWAKKNLHYYLYRYLPKLLNLRSWRNRFTNWRKSHLDSTGESQEHVNVFDFRDWDEDDEMIAKMKKMLRQNIKILAIYTSDVDDYYAYQGQLADSIGNHGGLTEQFYKDAKHVYPVAIHRERAIRLVLDWATQAFQNP